MANEADLKLIQIPEFPKTDTLVGSGSEYVVLTKADGVTYGMLTEDFKAFLGTVQVQAPRAISPTDPAPTLDGVYEPTVNGVYANAGGLERLDTDGYVRFIKNGVAWVKVNTPLPESDIKLPLYSDIKSSSIASGTQFIDDENGGQFMVADGQTLLVGENPQDFINTKLIQLTEKIEPTNLYNGSTDKVDFRLDINTGASVASVGSKHSQPIRISPYIGYTVGRFPQKVTTAINVLRMVVFYNQSGVRMTPTEIGWGTGNYYIHTAVGDVDFKRDYYELIPLAQIPSDWKTNGLGQAPIPLNARFVAFNTVSSTFNLQETFSVFEKGYATPFRKFRETEFDYYKEALSTLFDKITIPNFFSYTAMRRNRTLNVVNAVQQTQADIDGLQYMTSDYIDASSADVWFLQGRNSTQPTNLTSKALAWYDEDFNLIQPIDEFGNNLPGPNLFALPYENGKVYRPANAKYVMFQALFKSSIALSPNIMFTPYTEAVDQYVSYGEYLVRASFMFNNNTVADGKLMVKSGDSFTGFDKPIENDYDGIFRVINFLASGIVKTQQLQFEYVNVLPNDPLPKIVWHENKLKLVQNGVAKEFSLI